MGKRNSQTLSPSASSARPSQGVEWHQSLTIVADMALGRGYQVVAKSTNFGASLSGLKSQPCHLLASSLTSPSPHFHIWKMGVRIRVQPPRV